MLISGSVCVTSDCFIDDILPRVQRPAFIDILLSIFGISTWLWSCAWCSSQSLSSLARQSAEQRNQRNVESAAEERANAGWVGVTRVRRRHLVGALNDCENHPAPILAGFSLAAAAVSVRPSSAAREFLWCPQFPMRISLMTLW